MQGLLGKLELVDLKKPQVLDLRLVVVFTASVTMSPIWDSSWVGTSLM
jgi:hypothetical protein